MVQVEGPCVFTAGGPGNSDISLGSVLNSDLVTATAT